MQHPTRGTPLGCVVGSLSIIPLAVASMGAYGWWKWLSLPEHKRSEEALDVLQWATAGGIVGFLAFGWIAGRILRKTDWKGFDADKPHSQI